MKGRPSIFDQIEEAQLERIDARASWPPALLARELGCSRASIYRHFPGREAISSNEVIDAVRRHQSSDPGESR